MNIKKLYKSVSEKGVRISPTKRRETDEEHGVRLIADEGFVLMNGDELTQCVDTHDPSGWTETRDTSCTR